MRLSTLICLLLSAVILFAPGAATAEEMMPLVEDLPLAEDELLEDDYQMEVPLDIAMDEPLEDAAGDDGADTAEIRRAQQLLIDLGLLTGVADGKVGPLTTAALNAFQEQNGLVKTGALDEATLRKMDEVSRSGQSVRTVQQRLIDLGYLSGTADGKFGSRSSDAIKLFQQLHNLNVSGLIDNQTLDRLFSEDALSIHGPLIPGDKGTAVIAMQNRLRQYGFSEDEADGAYGKKTITSVKAFQQHLIDQGLGSRYGITADGNASAMTQYFLFSDSYTTYLKDVALGETDSEVLRVERKLYNLGYMDVAPSDTLDDYALQALHLFEEKAGVSAAEGINRAVIDALFSENAPVADHCVPHDIASGDKGVAVRNVQEALVRGGMLAKVPDGKYGSELEKAVKQLYSYLEDTGYTRSALFADPAALSVKAQEALQDDLLGFREVADENASEAEILRVQRRLNTLYYLARTSIDGQYGDKTREAVTGFQADNGLAETGIADADTQKLMFSAQVRPKQLPYRVEVSIDKQRVYVYERGEDGEYTHTQTFICSTGLGNATPRGIFLEGHPVNRWHHFEKFNCWAQYSYIITGDIMFHSVLYSTNSVSTLRSGSVWALGSKASHGCIRLKVADAKWLFEHCKRGTLAILIY